MNPVKIVLYADDDIDDKSWVTDACQAVNSSFQLEFVENGRQALDFLEKEVLNNKVPSLIVLDLNMPELDGRQTLKRIKEDPRFTTIPIVIVTTSANKIDRDVCHRLGASLYLTKPDTYREWQNIVHQLEPLTS